VLTEGQRVAGHSSTNRARIGTGPHCQEVGLVIA